MVVVILKRLAAVVLEMLLEALLLGVFFGFLTMPGQMHTLKGFALAPAPVVLVLFLFWYYVTRPLLGILWGSRRQGWYALAAGGLFAVHMCVACFPMTNDDLASDARQAMPFFIAGGAVLVFIAALCGRRLLRKWTRSSRRLRRSAQSDDED